VVVSNSLYERDFYAWANQQAALLRAGRLAEADIENIAEEIESMGRSEKRELVSRLTTLLQHLLKWQFQPGRRSVSWRLSIENTRLQLEDHLEDNPSLKSQLDEAMRSAYRRALNEAVAETGFARATFPADSPYASEQAMNPDFWPE
jgi:predicted  nucleic acid-binding Zn-ribbon protein